MKNAGVGNTFANCASENAIILSMKQYPFFMVNTMTCHTTENKNWFNPKAKKAAIRNFTFTAKWE
jgi:hypothetical protein